MEKTPTYSANILREEIFQEDEKSMKFVIPSAAPVGIYDVELETSSGVARIVLNKPMVYWIQGDHGEFASSGGWIRAFGRSVSLSGRVEGRLRSKNVSKKAFLMNSVHANLWEAKFALDASIDAGSYYFEIRDLAGDWVAAGTIAVEAKDSRKLRSFDVRAFGAAADGIQDDTNAVIDAIQAASEEGGGEVRFSPGQYRLGRQVVIPPGVTLVGSSREEVLIFWSDFSDPPEALIRGSRDFGLFRLSLYASNYKHFIVVDDILGSSGNVELSELRVNGNAFRGHLTIEQVDARFRAQQNLKPFGSDLVRLRGRNIRITNSDFTGSGRTLAVNDANHVYIANSTFRNGRWGWYSFSGCSRVIFENNVVVGADLMSSGGGINTLGGRRASENIFFGGNRFESLFGWDREAVTSDGSGGFFYGYASSKDPAAIRLKRWIEGRPRDSVRQWDGAGVFVLGGTGMGQFARVQAYLERDEIVLLESPLRVALDESSVITIVPVQQNYIFYKNEFIDSGISIQFYGTSLNHIVAENVSRRSSGIVAFGRWYRHYQPTWFCQFFRNRIAEGAFYRGGPNNTTELGRGGIGTVGLQRPPNRMPLALGAIHRGNTIDEFGEFRFEGLDERNPGVRDVIIELDDFKRLINKVTIDRGVTGALIRCSPRDLLCDKERQSAK